MKHLLKSLKFLIITVLTFSSIGLYSQEGPITSIEKESIFDIKTDQYYQVVLAFYTTETDTIALLSEEYDGPFTIRFMNNQNYDSTAIIIEISPKKVFLAGDMIFHLTVDENDNHFDVFKGKVMSVVKKELQHVDMLIDRFYPNIPDENEYYRLLIIYDDHSVLQFILS